MIDSACAVMMLVMSPSLAAISEPVGCYDSVERCQTAANEAKSFQGSPGHQAPMTERSPVMICIPAK
jgi:hypothetical protein